MNELDLTFLTIYSGTYTTFYYHLKVKYSELVVSLCPE